MSKTYSQNIREAKREAVPNLLRNLNCCQQELNDQLAAILRSEASMGAATRLQKGALKGILAMVQDDARRLAYALDIALEQDDPTT